MAHKTIQEVFSAEIEEKRSRFFAHLVPIAEFESVLDHLRLEHKKASHHVTAFRKMETDNRITEGCKDDGEPSGTSGMPVLKTLTGYDLVDVGVIVTRYFGGTKLGTGGLARAYSGAVKAVIEIAELQNWQRIIQDDVFARFSESAEIERQVSGAGLTVISREFVEEGVKLLLEGPEEAMELFLDR